MGGQSVRRRVVLYISGFDPRGGAPYHAMYESEAAKQAAAGGIAIHVGKRQRLSAHMEHWLVSAEAADGARVQTDYRFLRWDDIVRAHWPRGPLALLATTLGTTARLLARGQLWRMWQTSWPAGLALTLPALTLALAAAGVGVMALGLINAWLVLPGALLLALGLLLGRRAQGAWLMRSARKLLRQGRGEVHGLEARLDEFAAHAAEVLAQGHCDELLLVGHSSGCMLAQSVAARALARREGLVASPTAFALLTLGHCTPVLSYQPEAEGFRAELRALRQRQGLYWLDVTAPVDGCCFALSDPTEVVAGHGGGKSGRGPVRLSPRWHELFSPAAYAALRRDKYRCHFQYLMASHTPGRCDYFALTAGDQTLSQRFAGEAGVTAFTAFQRLGDWRR